MTFAGVRRLVIGQPLATAHAIHQRLPKYLALSVFGSDPISSSAYATEEILLALVVAGSVGLRYAVGVAVAIALLFVFVSISYRQTVTAYPSGGGACIVARENLGTIQRSLPPHSHRLRITVAVGSLCRRGGHRLGSSGAGALRVMLGVLCVTFIAWPACGNASQGRCSRHRYRVHWHRAVMLSVGAYH
jgi:amino acid transporter